MREAIPPSEDRDATGIADARFRTLFDQGVQFAGILELDGTVIEVNRLALEACGFAREDALGKPFWECGWWNRSQAVMDRVRSACERAAQGQYFREESRYFVADGSERFVDLIIAPVFDADGRVLFLNPTGVDISERKRIEADLLASRTESDRQRRVYEAILTNTPDLAYVWGLDHRFVYVNEGLLRMWGRTREEAIGRTCLELGYEPWHAALHDREIDQVVATRQPIRGEVPFAGTNGRRIYDYILVPVLAANGEVEAVAGTTRDVTDRKRAEEELRKLADELADSDRRKSEFLAILAHELRNPLAPIRNALEIVRQSDDDVQTLRRASVLMERQVDHMVRLVDDLLDLSRISRGKIELRRERVELASIVQQAVETCRPALDRARHAFDAALPTRPLYLHADPVRLAQVFSNLIHNACKYSEPEGRITLRAERQGSEVVVSVEDAGIGIEPALLPSIFDMFTQVDRSPDRSQDGLGIGLTLVKTLVEMHGGRVEAHSAGLGRGSRFVVRLPILIDAPAPSVGPQLAAAAARPRRRILVVDDNRDSAESLALLLQMRGDETQTAFDGLEAVATAATFQPDVVLLDLGLPKLNGYGACAQMRQQAAGRNLVVVALTGWGQDEDRQKSAEAGFDAHMVKPVNHAALDRLLVSLLGGSTSEPRGQ